jgi:predicted acyltransferase
MEPAAPNTQGQGRNLAIDMLRALTMTLMIFVNDFWKVHDVPQWMEHAKHGVDFMGLSDFVYPAFLFCVGMSVPYAIENRYRKGYSGESTMGHILLRVLSLLIMGAFLGNSEARLAPDFTLYRIGTYWLVAVASFFLVWNAYPKNPSRRQSILFTCLKIIGGLCLLFLAVTYRKPDGRVFDTSFSILGGIAWTYLVAAVVYYFCRDNLRKIVPVWIAVLAVCVLTQRMRPEMGDVAILNFPRPNFLEGMLRVLHIGNGGSVFLALSGLLVSVVTEKIAGLPQGKRILIGLGTALAAFLLGVFTRRFWIAAKLGLTLPCCLFVSAIAIAVYTLLRFLNSKGLSGWFAIIRPAGTATLSTYMIPYVFYGFADITGIVLPDWLTHSPMSLVNCFCFALICIAIVGILQKLHIKLKV